jgi:hypothetical protein
MAARMFTLSSFTLFFHNRALSVPRPARRAALVEVQPVLHAAAEAGACECGVAGLWPWTVLSTSRRCIRLMCACPASLHARRPPAKPAQAGLRQSARAPSRRSRAARRPGRRAARAGHGRHARDARDRRVQGPDQRRCQARHLRPQGHRAADPPGPGHAQVRVGPPAEQRRQVAALGGHHRRGGRVQGARAARAARPAPAGRGRAASRAARLSRRRCGRAAAGAVPLPPACGA